MVLLGLGSLAAAATVGLIWGDRLRRPDRGRADPSSQRPTAGARHGGPSSAEPPTRVILVRASRRQPWRADPSVENRRDLCDRRAVCRCAGPCLRRGVSGRLHLRGRADVVHPPGRVRRLRRLRTGLPGRGDLLRGRRAGANGRTTPGRTSTSSTTWARRAVRPRSARSARTIRWSRRCPRWGRTTDHAVTTGRPALPTAVERQRRRVHVGGSRGCRRRSPGCPTSRGTACCRPSGRPSIPTAWSTCPSAPPSTGCRCRSAPPSATRPRRPGYPDGARHRRGAAGLQRVARAGARGDRTWTRPT